MSNINPDGENKLFNKTITDKTLLSKNSFSNTLIAKIDEKLILSKNGLPQRIRNWQIEKKLGKGATATVYLGKSLIDKSLVAIKQFSSDLFQNNQHAAAYRKMMKNEANLVGKLVHPNILQTYSVGFESEQKYLVMEYVEKGSLEDLVINPNQLGLSEILRLFFQCACGLQYSDEIGIIHRDIKPANVLLQTGNIPKITDFGSSMKKGDDKNAINGVGSPAYMSPEQICERPLNQQTDIYSLGVSLFEMISGHKPFSASTQYETVFKILHEEAPLISFFVKSSLPAKLEEILSKSMRKKQEERYQSWAEFIYDLSLLLQSMYKDDKKYKLIEDIVAFDWLRACSSLKMFDDNELWDLIQNGKIYSVGYATRFEVVHNNNIQEDEFANMNNWEFKESKNIPKVSSHSFVLSGAIQVYDTDEKISVLTVGDYIADIKPLLNPKYGDRVDAYSIAQTVIITIEDEKINNIHPVVKNKLTTLIRLSAETQRAIKHIRHDKNQKVYTEEDLINSEISINKNAYKAVLTKDGDDFFDANAQE